MAGAGWIGLAAGAVIVAAVWGGLDAGGADAPGPKEDAPVAKAESVTLWTVALMPPLSLGGQEFHTVRVNGTPGGRGRVELDPNPVVTDRFGTTIKTGLRAFKPVEVEMAPLAEPTPPGEGAPGGAADGAHGWRLYDLRPVAPASAWPGKVALRLAVGGAPCGPYRLLVVEGAGGGGEGGGGGAVVRIVTLEGGR